MFRCAQQKVRVSADDLAERRAQGSQPWGFGINQLVHELIIAEVTQNTDRAAISLSEVVDLIERETYFETKYYLRAGIAARENQVEHAMAILEQSLTAADPGIFGQDVLGMRPDHSLLLEPLRGLPEFEDWLQRHRQQRSALLDRMRQLENQGEIYSAASLERLAQE